MRLIDAGKLLDELNERKIPYDAEINEMIVSQKNYEVEKLVEKLRDAAIERYGTDNGMGG